MKRLVPLFILSLFALVACNDDDRGISLNRNLVKFIENRYDGAVIRYAEYDGHGLKEVEILHDALIKDVYFSSGDDWVYTSWNVRIANLPATVRDAVAAAYPDFLVEEADYFERPSNAYYVLELEYGDVSVVVNVTAEGNLLI